MKSQNRRATPLERVIQAQICAVLDHYGVGRGILVYERTNAGSAYDGNGRRIRLGTSGTSDLKVYRMGGRTTHMEIKRAHGKLSSAQRVYRDAVTALGHEYVVVRSPEDVEALIAKWNAERIRDAAHAAAESS